MSDFNLKRQESMEHEEGSVDGSKNDGEIYLEEEEEEFVLEPTYKSMGLPDHASDVVIDDGFNFRDEPTRGIDFLKPLAFDTVPDFDTTVSPLDEERNYTEPPRLPIDLSLFPLEKTHFLTNANPINVCQEFRKAFEIKGVTITKFNMEKYKFKCEFDVKDKDGKSRELVSFRARIYTVNKDKKYVVELQRRDGCCLEWRKLYNNLKETIPLDQIVQ